MRQYSPLIYIYIYICGSFRSKLSAIVIGEKSGYVGGVASFKYKGFFISVGFDADSFVSTGSYEVVA